MKMTVNRNTHAIALSDKEFALLEIIYKTGPCSLEVVQEILQDPNLIGIMRLLHDLTARGFLIRPEIDEQLLYSVKPNYAEVRRRIIVLEDQ
jgi:hypothetical protein